MDKKSNLYLWLKVIFILAFLPFVLIWGIWEKTDWNKTSKWLTTAGIAVVFLFIILSSSKNGSTEKETISPSDQAQKIEELQKQLDAEKQKNIDIETKKGDEEIKKEEIPKTEETIIPEVNVPTQSPTTTAIPTPKPTPTPPMGIYTCNCSKTCPQMSSCAEAQYQLNTCGCSRRDADHDGVACDADCQ